MNKRNWQYPDIIPDTSVDYYFSKKVIDPYRNIEKFESAIVKSWIEKQNKLYDSIIHNITNHEMLDSEIAKMKKMRKKWIDFPRVVGHRVFYPFGFFNDNDIERLGYTDSLHKDPIELFNTKEISEKNKNTYTFNYYEPSLDGKYIAFGISPNGSEKATIYVTDVEKKALLPEKIEYSIGGNIQWLSDGSGFFYMRDKPILNEDDKKTFYEDAKVMLHKLYNDPQKDREIFSRLLNKDLGLEKISWPRIFVFPSSNKVLINYKKGSYCIVYYANLNDVLNKPAETILWKKICDEKERISNNVLYGDLFLGLSYKHNPNGQLISMKLPDLNSKVVFDASNFSLDDLVITNNSLYITILEKGLNKLIKINLQDYRVEDVKLPYLGGINILPPFNIATSYQASNYLMFTITNYNKQRAGFICDENKQLINTNIYQEVQYLDPPLNLISEEIEVPSHDGVMVPLSIVYRKDLKFDCNNPTIIEAYGAYGVSYKPEFKRDRLAWFNHGGVYAFAHVRGGGEKGDDWYKGGFKATKSNSWKDLIACAEYLIKHKYTSTEKLAAMGASAGGITVGRSITERPDLFKAGIIYVGLMNTIRTENTFNPSTDEFGTVKDSSEFHYLFDMDTYHHIVGRVKYPSILFTAGLNDSRVAPWLPAKAVAKMQEVGRASGNIVLFRVQDEGHFNYPSESDIYSFLFWQLGHPDFKLKEKDCMFKTLQN